MAYCSDCKKDVHVEILDKVGKVEVCGKEVRVKFKSAYCTQCLKELELKEVSAENLKIHADLLGTYGNL